MISGRIAGLALSAAAVAVAACVTVGAQGAILKSANTGATSTSATPTTTSGQRQILAKFDPYEIDEFQLDVTYDPARFSFEEIHGINGYVIDSYIVEHFMGEGPETGRIDNIAGHFGPEVMTEGFGPIPPPAGYSDLFEVLFNDLNPTIAGKIGIEASDANDFLEGSDPLTGQSAFASGPDQIDPSSVIIPADAIGPGGGGGAAAPLPGALAMGLVGGAGVIGNAVRKRRRA